MRRFARIVNLHCLAVALFGTCSAGSSASRSGTSSHRHRISHRPALDSTQRLRKITQWLSNVSSSARAPCETPLPTLPRRQHLLRPHPVPRAAAHRPGAAPGREDHGRAPGRRHLEWPGALRRRRPVPRPGAGGGERELEVDFVLSAGPLTRAIEVKSGRGGDLSGLGAFLERRREARPMIVGAGGMPLEEFFLADPVALLR